MNTHLRVAVWYALPAFLGGFMLAALLFGRRDTQGSSEVESDSNADGKPDIVYDYTAGTVKSMKSDRNFDGAFDYFEWYANGTPARFEADDNFDGRIDVWGTFRLGNIETVKDDTDFNGEPDSISVYTNGIPMLRAWTPNRALRIVKFEKFLHGIKREELLDTNADGIFEVTNFFDAFENPRARP